MSELSEGDEMSRILTAREIATMRAGAVNFEKLSVDDALTLIASHEELRAEQKLQKVARIIGVSSRDAQNIRAEVWRSMNDFRPMNADVLNQELRENYGGAHEVDPDGDWRAAIRALVDGVRYGERRGR